MARRDFKNKNTYHLIFLVLGLAFIIFGLKDESYVDGVKKVGPNYPMVITGVLILIWDTYNIIKKILDKKDQDDPKE